LTYIHVSNVPCVGDRPVVGSVKVSAERVAVAVVVGMYDVAYALFSN
jgi:hypothetical protein